jgi:transcriptional repressor NrdR
VICPFCQANDDKVIDSRASEQGKVIRRRRQCLKCERRFTTYERVEEFARLTVIKRDGSHVPFSRDSVAKGIALACGKRPIPEDAKQRIVDEIEEECGREYDREVPTRAIGLMVCLKLKDLDEVAYLRFATEYYRFADLAEIQKELDSLRARVKDTKDQTLLFPST